ncbi:RWD domain-containing protein [Polychytrium aggregatum]|uniref:RWD domain-containing protein n=1 Tax=Polychytrium aggregatum TaxID=110093 RepID=UPI0022FE0534|nr:RWD domain-containing protein [Polychytrium aggregatum]KAI9204995.1 RWD domain-containing protein [Polychytrium aggregatum]
MQPRRSDGGCGGCDAIRCDVAVAVPEAGQSDNVVQGQAQPRDETGRACGWLGALFAERSSLCPSQPPADPPAYPQPHSDPAASFAASMNFEDRSESQQNEILALEAIYDQDLKRSLDGTKEIFTVIVRPDLPESVLLCPAPESSPSPDVSVGPTVAHLPPIRLQFSFPHGYPESDPPELKISCFWMTESQIDGLKKSLLELWSHERDSIIYTIVEYIRFNALSFVAFDPESNPARLFLPLQQSQGARSRLSDHQDDPANSNDASVDRTRVDISQPAADQLDRDMLGELMQFDLIERRRVFDNTTFKCGICLDYFSGSSCQQFRACQHVFCIECLHGYMMAIMKQSAETCQRINCPDPDCFKSRSRDEPEDYETIGAVVGPIRLRWLKTIREKETAIKTGLVPRACPRRGCGTVNYQAKTTKLVECSRCRFPFCGYCGLTYHGIANYCPSDPEYLLHMSQVQEAVELKAAVRDLGKSAEEYLEFLEQARKFKPASRGPKPASESNPNPDPDDADVRIAEVRELLEPWNAASEKEKVGLMKQQRFIDLRAKIREVMEDRLSMTIVLASSRQCPGCGARIQRTEGCPHMTCTMCFSEFCYVCEAPYGKCRGTCRDKGMP